MTLSELVVALEASQIDPRAYRLNDPDEFPPEAFVMRFCRSGVVGRQGHWEAYYSERGMKSGLRRFESEEDACHYFLDWIGSDQSARLD